MNKVSIVDYNMGNLASIKNAFDKIGKESDIIKRPEEILKADRLLLPGVGAFPDAMRHLKENGVDEAIAEFASSGKPLLGICLGMQLLFEVGYEFYECKGLELLKGEVVKFDKSYMRDEHKIPHIGWNTIDTKPSPLFEGIDKHPYLYFVHSFHVVTDDKLSIGYTNYGYRFVSAVNMDNIYGLQPHPEKSHNVGLKILENFTRL